MKNRGTRIILAIFLLLSQHLFAGSQTMHQGWEAFNNNKRKEAIELFQKAAADADTKADANLALCLVYWSEEKNDEGFKAFQNFFSASPDPYPYLYALWNAPVVFNGDEKKKDERLDLLKKLAMDPKANGTIQAMAHAMTGKHYEAIGDFKAANAEYEKIGAISNWQVLGTFDNTSGSGFNKDFRVIANPEPDAAFTNKADADISWFTPPFERSDKWFDFDFYMDIHNSIMYAQTYLKSDIEQQVYFRSGNSGSLKIWVNDKLVTDVSEERNCDLDIYTNNVKLAKGYNRVVVQIGESESGRANFMIRATDKEGRPVKGLSTTTDYQLYKPAEDYTVNNLTLFAEDFFEAKVKADPDNLINHLLLSDVYLRNDKVYEARKALKKAQQLAPDNTFVGQRLIEAYVRDNDVTDVTKEYEKIKSTDPESVYAMKGLIEEARQKENFDEEERLMEKYKTLYGEDEYTDLLALNISASRNKYDEIVTTSKRLYEKYPDNIELMNLAYTIERNTSKDLAKANVILKDFLKRDYSDKVMTTLATNYFDLGSKKEAFEIYNQRIANYPYSIGYYSDLSDIYFAAQDYENALKWAQKTLEFAPYVGSYWNKVGTIYQAMNKPAEAKDAFKKAIYYTPTNYEARKQLRKLEGKKDLFENFAKTDAYELYKNSPKAEEYPEDNSIVLLNEMQKVVYPEGAAEEKSEMLIKVFNQNGIDTWKEYAVAYNRFRQRLIIDKAEVLKKDGNKVQAEKNEDVLVFTNLESGDAIHVSYRLEDYNTGKLAQQFWEQFNFNVEYPVKLARYSLLVPAKEQFQSQVLHAGIKPTITNMEDMKMYVWEAKDQPGIKPEPYMPALSDVGAILDISTIPDWKYVSNWYSDLSSNLAKTDFEIKETVATLLANKKGLSDLEKAKLIYQFIEENVSYSNVPFMHGPIIPQKASRTLSTKLGDCKDVSTLFVAMCKEAGLKANLTLVDTRDNGGQHLSLPSIDFDHCVAQLEAGGKKYYVELTDQKLSFGTIPTIDLNSNILFIPRSGDSAATQLTKFNSDNRSLNSIIRESALKFDSNDVIIDRKNIKTGMFAAQMRSDYDNQGKEKQEKMITQALAADFNTPTRLLNLHLGDLKALSDTAVYDYSFVIKNHLSEVVGIKIFRIPWSEGVRSLDFLSLENRKYAFLIWAYNAAEASKETMDIDIPKGKVLAEQPKSVKLSCSAADYTLTYTLTPGKLKVVREMKYKKDEVAATEYAQFRDFYNKVAEADSKQIGFK